MPEWVKTDELATLIERHRTTSKKLLAERIGRSSRVLRRIAARDTTWTSAVVADLLCRELDLNLGVDIEVFEMPYRPYLFSSELATAATNKRWRKRKRRMMGFIAQPSVMLKRYARSQGFTISSGSYHLGRMGMALEIITQIKCLEELKVMDDASRAEAVTALETLLKDCGILDEAYTMYERLDEWRKPKFVPTHPLLRHDDGLVPERARSVAAAVAAAREPHLLQDDLESSSPNGGPASAASLRGTQLSLPEEHHGLDGGSSPSRELEGPSS